MAPTRIVAVTASTEIIRGLPRVRVNVAYTDAVRGAGLVPVVVPPMPAREAVALLDRVDGLLLTGGEDVSPEHYGEPAHHTVDDTHALRDECELALVGAARERALPTLAICRGIQVLNVALGGSLVQDIASVRPDALAHDRSDARTERVHDVRVDAGSRLAAALGADALRVNSSHHQALARVADGLRVTACAEDGVVEGAEWRDDDWWLLGVQWHPEELVRTAEPWDRALFAAFARAVGAGSGAEAASR